MATNKKITTKEFMNYVQSQLVSQGFTRAEIDAVNSAFSSDLKDVDIEERRPFFGNPIPGITEKEVNERMSEIRDPHSVFSRNSKVRLCDHPAKLDVLEKILHDALAGDKESRWF